MLDFVNNYVWHWTYFSVQRWSGSVRVYQYLLTEDGFNGVLHLCWIIYVDGPDVRPSDVNLSVRVLGGQLGSKVKHIRYNRFWTQKLSKTIINKLNWRTSLSVGLPLKKSVFLLLLDGSNLGLRKAQPLAMASRGAGPSYGKDSPTNSWRTDNSYLVMYNKTIILH